MAGFLSGLADRFQANRPRLSGYLSDNSNALLGFASGVFSGQGPTAIGQGLQGFMQGGQLDRQAAMDQDAEKQRQILQAQEAQRQQSLAMALDEAGITGGQRAYAESDPEYARQIAMDYYTPDPPAPPPDYPSSYDEYQLMLSDPGFAEHMAGSAEPVDYPTSVDEYLYGIENPDFAKQQAIAANGGGIDVINNIPGDEAPPGPLDTQIETMFGAIIEEGVKASGDLFTIERLSGLLQETGGGLQAGLVQLAGRLGIEVSPTTDAVQAASALISYLVPRQRPPGSGVATDFDARMFMDSLPRLMNQPGGNELIIQTIGGLAQLKVAQGEVAMRYAMREINPATGQEWTAAETVRAMNELPDPFEAFKAAMDGTLPAGVQAPAGSDGWVPAQGGGAYRVIP